MGLVGIQTPVDDVTAAGVGATDGWPSVELGATRPFSLGPGPTLGAERRTGDRRQAALDHEEHTTEGDNGDHRRRGKGGPERGPAIPPAEDGPLSGSMRLVEDGVDDPIRQDLHPIRQVGGQERFGIAWLLHAGCSCSTAEVRASASRAARIAAVA